MLQLWVSSVVMRKRVVGFIVFSVAVCALFAESTQVLAAPAGALG